MLIDGEVIDNITDLSSIAALNTFLPNVAANQTTDNTVAPTTPNTLANNANNSTIDEHNIASVSMPFFIIIFFYLFILLIHYFSVFSDCS